VTKRHAFKNKKTMEHEEQKPCCEPFKKLMLHFDWYKVEGEDLYAMPCMDKFRINFCPSCGAYIRAIMLKREEFPIS
jgi:hypothetical protein